MMSKKVLERIRKCIALSASSNIEEARTAAYLACQMIREHKVELKSVEYDDVYITRNAAERAARPRWGDADGYVTADDLNSFFRTTGPAYVFTCRGCGGRVSYTSQSFSAEGGVWHLECWAKKRQKEAREPEIKCAGCGSGSSMGFLNLKDGGSWHPECWLGSHCIRCKLRFREGDEIKKKSSTGERWHRECFEKHDHE